MNTLSKVRFCAVILTILSTLFTFGCKNPFNPKQSSLSVHTSWLPNNSAENVLKNLENAYNRKDLDLYTSILDKNFHFELISSEAPEINAGIDLDEDGYPDSWWGYQTEVEYHTNLFRDGSTDGRFPPPDEILLFIGSFIALTGVYAGLYATSNFRLREKIKGIYACFGIGSLCG